MATLTTDQNLVMGLLALHMEFIDRAQLVTAIGTWLADKQASLTQVLTELGHLTPEHRSLIEVLAAEKLKRSGGDAAHALNALGAPRDVVAELKHLVDPELHVSLRHLQDDRASPNSTPPSTGPRNGDTVGTAAGPSVSSQSAPKNNVAGDAASASGSRATMRGEAPSADPYATSVVEAQLPGQAPAPPPPAPRAKGGATQVMNAQGTAPPAGSDPFSTNLAPTVVHTSANTAPSGPAPGMRFRVLRPFARGGLGEVLVAEDQELHREVALKQIQERHADDVASRARFIMEAEITGNLEHPGIVPVYGLGQYADGRPYYAMRFIRGDSLHDAIEKFHKEESASRDPGERALALRQLLGRFIDVCQAIEYAHSRGILHRDLKPGNIMLGKYGETLVVDWGLAKPVGQTEHMPERSRSAVDEGVLAPAMTGAATMMGCAVGTPHYMSPEQAAGQLDLLGPASDVYSLGGTLYTLLTGVAAIPDRDVNTILQRVKTGDFPRPRAVKSNVPLPLEAICLKAMALKPENRYATSQLLADDIEHWLADEPVAAYREPWHLRAGRWLRRHKTLATGVGASVLVAAVGLGIATVLLTAANERERQAKDKAEANFRLAREAVDRYQTNVSESILLNEPGMQPLRIQLLADAKKFYDKFVQERKDDPALRAELGRALYRLGLITADIDTRNKAIDLLEEAAGKFELEEAKYQVELARCYHHLGRLYRLTEQVKKSEDMYRKALDGWEASGAADTGHVAEVVRSRVGLGNAFQYARRLEDAQNEYRKALEIWVKLTPEQANVPEIQREKAKAHFNLGQVLAALGGRAKEARAEFATAIALLNQLAKDQPNLSQVQDELATSHYLLGDLELQTGDRKGAMSSMQAAEKIWKELTTDHPTVRQFHTRRADALVWQAKIWGVDGKGEEAIKAGKEALDVQLKLASKAPDSTDNRGDLARRRSEVGDVLRLAKEGKGADLQYQAALSVQGALVRENEDVPQFQLDLARTYYGIGLLRRDEGKASQAEEAFVKALDQYDAVQKRSPEAEESAQGVARTCLVLRSVMRLPGGGRIALEPLDRAMGVYTSLAKAKERPAMERALYQAAWTRAEARDARAMYVEALQDWDLALPLATGIDPSWVKLYRLVTLAGYEPDRALSEAAPLLEKAGKVPDALFELARVHARAAALQAKLTDDMAARKKSEQNAIQAQDLLDRAAKFGYFRSESRRHALADHPDWEILRSRPAFQAWLKNLHEEKPAMP